MAIILLIGCALLTVALGILIWTRWGQAHPLGKCVGLSVFAHLLLLIFAYATQVLHAVPGNPDSEVFEVRLIDTGDADDASPWADPSTERHGESGFGAIASEDEPAPIDGSTDESDASDLEIEPGRTAPPLLTASLTESPTTGASQATPPEPSNGDAVEEVSPTLTDLVRPDSAVASENSESYTPQAPLTGDASQSSPLADIALPGIDRRDRTDPLDPQHQPQPVFAAIPVAAPASDAAGAARALPTRKGDGQALPELYAARMTSDRLQIAQQHGGDINTEAAVSAALEWLAANQNADGRWDADRYGAGREIKLLGHDRGGAGAQADTGITGLALLALLGAGNTHLEGDYRQNVQHGLEFLLLSQAANGSLQGEAELFASMYCHGIATLALSEAYAMSGDPRLRDGLRQAIRYTIASQHSGGGWRYQPGDAGDMSQFGWQVMALKSAEVGGLPIPHETRFRMSRFLRTVTSGRQEGLASYRPGERPSRTMTAEALVCRSLAGIENSFGAMDEGGHFIMEKLPGNGPPDFYHYYYATLAMYQRQGSDWDRWNKALQHELLKDQRRDRDAAGSWDPDPTWGSYGGRVYSTALGALCLEVYYRYLPLYNNDFPVEPRWVELPNGPAPR